MVIEFAAATPSFLRPAASLAPSIAGPTVAAVGSPAAVRLNDQFDDMSGQLESGPRHTTWPECTGFGDSQKRVKKASISQADKQFDV
jgi:hypothetical protein